jgi:hypothetical protein
MEEHVSRFKVPSQVDCLFFLDKAPLITAPLQQAKDNAEQASKDAKNSEQEFDLVHSKGKKLVCDIELSTGETIKDVPAVYYKLYCNITMSSRKKDSTHVDSLKKTLV